MAYDSQVARIDSGDELRAASGNNGGLQAMTQSRDLIASVLHCQDTVRL